jgi:glycosyltransferase involved in cell wall biosynthesis
MYEAMIHVVHVINSLRLGGGERFVYDLVTHLDPGRFRPHILCLYHAGELAEPLKASGVPVDVLYLGRKIRPQGWFKMWQVLRRLKPHILHTHLPEACWYGLPAGRLAGVPVRIGHLQNVHRYWPIKLRLLDRAASIFATKSVACSEAVRQFYQNELSYSAAKLEVVCNSVDLKRFHALPDRSEARRLLGFPRDALIAICVAALDEQKGHRYLLEAILKVRAALPETLLLLVGDGSLRQKLEQDVQSRELTSTVRFLGRRTDIPLLLAASDLFVLPSLWEGFGIVLTEAGATGLPTVATDVDGIPEVINDGVTGILVPPANGELLAEAILTLLHDPARRIEMGTRARQFVRERFSISQIARDMELLYLSLLSKSNGVREFGSFKSRRTENG